MIISTKVHRLSRNLFACVLVGLLINAASIVCAAGIYTIVVNPTVNEQSISKNSLRVIFGMRLQTWPDGTPVRVFVLPDDNPAHNDFSKEVLNIFPYQLRAAWDRLTFSGTGQAPIEVHNEDEMRIKIATIPGAIGYLRGDMVNDQVHVLQVK